MSRLHPVDTQRSSVNLDTQLVRKQLLHVDLMNVELAEDTTEVEVWLVLPSGRPKRVSVPTHLFRRPEDRW